MKRVFYPYTLWEDFQNGMYNEDKENRQLRIEKALLLFNDLDLLYFYMKKVTRYWIYATEHNLTNSSMNHQAWLGQCACSMFFDIHEDETREAWRLLTNDQILEANAVADKVYNEWKEIYCNEKKIG